MFSMVEMDFAVLGCDACNLGGRMSKVVGRVSGRPYDRSTFEVWNGLLEDHKTFHIVNAVFRSP